MAPTSATLPEMIFGITSAFWTIAILKEWLRYFNVSFYSADRKPELVRLLQEVERAMAMERRDRFLFFIATEGYRMPPTRGTSPPAVELDGPDDSSKESNFNPPLSYWETESTASNTANAKTLKTASLPQT